MPILERINREGCTHEESRLWIEQKRMVGSDLIEEGLCEVGLRLSWTDVKRDFGFAGLRANGWG